MVNVPEDGVPNAPPVEYLPLKVFQSVDVKYPDTEVVAAGIPIETALEPLYEVPVKGALIVKALRLDPNDTPEIVDDASLVIAIAAEAEISPLTIVPSAIIVLVIVPVSPVVIIVPFISGTVNVLVVAVVILDN